MRTLQNRREVACGQIIDADSLERSVIPSLSLLNKRYFGLENETTWMTHRTSYSQLYLMCHWLTLVLESRFPEVSVQHESKESKDIGHLRIPRSKKRSYIYIKIAHTRTREPADILPDVWASCIIVRERMSQ